MVFHGFPWFSMARLDYQRVSTLWPLPPEAQGEPSVEALSPIADRLVGGTVGIRGEMTRR